MEDIVLSCLAVVACTNSVVPDLVVVIIVEGRFVDGSVDGSVVVIGETDSVVVLGVVVVVKVRLIVVVTKVAFDVSGFIVTGTVVVAAIHKINVTSILIIGIKKVFFQNFEKILIEKIEKK